MTAKWPPWLPGIPVFGSTLASLIEIPVGVVSLAQMITASVAVVAGGWCLGDRMFDHIHGAADAEDSTL